MDGKYLVGSGEVNSSRILKRHLIFPCQKTAKTTFIADTFDPSLNIFVKKRKKQTYLDSSKKINSPLQTGPDFDKPEKPKKDIFVGWIGQPTLGGKKYPGQSLFYDIYACLSSATQSQTRSKV